VKHQENGKQQQQQQQLRKEIALYQKQVLMIVGNRWKN
jgi:hypothetical protein